MNQASTIEPTLVETCFVLYLVAALMYVVYAASRSNRVGQVASALAWLGAGFNLAALVARGVAAGRVPYATMYEYLLAFSCATALVYLVLEWRYSAGRSDLRPAGALAVLLAAGLLGYASKLGEGMRSDMSIMPLLRSNWLIFHVFTAIIGYGAAGVASAMAVLHVIRSRWPGQETWLGRFPEPGELDQVTYRCIAFAFPFLALVNITGAIWGYDAWGRYWGWDPKETWSLITWLVYAFYLHARLRGNWRGVKLALVAVIGFATILFTFIGVNLLSTFAGTLHSYASGS